LPRDQLSDCHAANFRAVIHRLAERLTHRGLPGGSPSPVARASALEQACRVLDNRLGIVYDAFRVKPKESA